MKRNGARRTGAYSRLRTRFARHSARATGLMAAAVILTACSSAPAPKADASPSPPPGASPSATTAALSLVVVGDSIGFGGHFCPGCTDFAHSYATSSERATGHPVVLTNRARDDSANLSDIQTQLVQDQTLRTQLKDADIVIVSVGFNDGPPWPATTPCRGEGEAETAAAQISTVLTYTPRCIKATVASYRSDYDQIYDDIASLAPKSATLLTLDVYNNWIGHPDLAANASNAQIDRVAALTKTVWDAWNAMLCSTADSHGFQCVDIYRGFNGANGLAPIRAWVVDDYTHPSQTGHDLIAGLLDKAKTKPITQ